MKLDIKDLVFESFKKKGEETVSFSEWDNGKYEYDTVVFRFTNVPLTEKGADVSHMYWCPVSDVKHQWWNQENGDIYRFYKNKGEEPILKLIPEEAIYDALLVNHAAAVILRNRGYLKEGAHAPKTI